MYVQTCITACSTVSIPWREKQSIKMCPKVKSKYTTVMHQHQCLLVETHVLAAEKLWAPKGKGPCREIIPSRRPPPFLREITRPNGRFKSLFRSLFVLVSTEYSEYSGQCVISGFRSEVYENCALLGYYAASSGNFLPTFWDNVLVPSLGAKTPKESNSWTLKMGLIGCPETSVRNYNNPLRNNPEERTSHNAQWFSAT